MKRRREGEGVTLEEEEEVILEEKEEAANGADANPEEEEETEISEEFKKFIEEKAKSTITSLFGNLLDIVEGKAVNPSPPAEDKAETEKMEDIEEAFANLQNSIRSMKIPESITSSIRQEFLASKQGKEATTRGKTSTSGTRRKLNRDNFKVPTEKSSPADSVLLNPITSDKSTGSGKSSEKGKLVTNYSCPFAPSCMFTLTKAEMREMTKASQHLIKEHKVPIYFLAQNMNGLRYEIFKVTSEDTKAAIAAKNQKYKFGKLKQMSA